MEGQRLGLAPSIPRRFLLGLVGYSAAWEVTLGFTFVIFPLWHV